MHLAEKYRPFQANSSYKSRCKVHALDECRLELKVSTSIYEKLPPVELGFFFFYMVRINNIIPGLDSNVVLLPSNYLYFMGGRGNRLPPHLLLELGEAN